MENPIKTIAYRCKELTIRHKLKKLYKQFNKIDKEITFLEGKLKIYTL